VNRVDDMDAISGDCVEGVSGGQNLAIHDDCADDLAVEKRQRRNEWLVEDRKTTYIVLQAMSCEYVALS